MTVLSVSADGEHFQHFYLDKVVCVKPGVRFALRPYQEKSRVDTASGSEWQTVGSIASGDRFQIRRHIVIDSIYTFFYQ